MALRRLARHRGTTQAEVLERLIQEEQQRVLDGMSGEKQDRFYDSENLEDIRAWVQRNLANEAAGRPISPFPQPRQYSYRELQRRLFPGLSLSTVRRLLKDLEKRKIIALLPGDPSEQTHRISLSLEVSTAIHNAIEASYQQEQRMKSEKNQQVII